MTSPLYNHKNAMPIIDFNWPVLTEYDHSQANVKPAEDDAVVELRYEVERLKRDVELQTDLKNKSIKEHHTYMIDYRKLDTDYLNSQGEVKKLKAKLDFFEGLEQYNDWLMQQYLKVKNKSAEEKKEVDRTWL